MTKAGIAGGSGYAGMELLPRLARLAEHSVFELSVLASSGEAGASFSSSLMKSAEIKRLWRLPVHP